jgi:hypothetical protein
MQNLVAIADMEVAKEEAKIASLNLDDAFFNQGSNINPKLWDSIQDQYEAEVCTCGHVHAYHNVGFGACCKSGCTCTSFEKKNN